ncbi:hypothetical protein [Cupriavidus respiraculi]|uniref:hypothetical protein n=1 Tax=Cupriavidus respiraculi TaxID=195930 RepID=UPI001C97CB6D|nr:hypothetical protein [Cupriavidus respiraculi]MBY4947037.1 hypothetical protein [Cupriavidus respiraculi]
MTNEQAAARQAAHIATAAEVFHALDELVLALDNTNWSSWQTTAGFSAQLEVARHVVARAKEQQQ